MLYQSASLRKIASTRFAPAPWAGKDAEWRCSRTCCSAHRHAELSAGDNARQRAGDATGCTGDRADGRTSLLGDAARCNTPRLAGRTGDVRCGCEGLMRLKGFIVESAGCEVVFYEMRERMTPSEEGRTRLEKPDGTKPSAAEPGWALLGKSRRFTVCSRKSYMAEKNWNRAPGDQASTLDHTLAQE
ncbi:hypothetical protein [Variovorax sp. CF313]|uniref:hypothetical protein n=1 Tax=Variovorax sp. CF313 TaxID=1144315 RepID=UPI0012FA609B|nr:hypothetical protein [Variovorax sp. CF313]